MITVFQSIHIILCVILISIILIQSGKGQGLAGAFGSFAGGAAQNLFGAKTTDVITKITGYLTAMFLVSAIFLAYLQFKEGKSVINSYKPPATSESPTKHAKQVDKKLKEITKGLFQKKESTGEATEEATVNLSNTAEETQTVSSQETEENAEETPIEADDKNVDSKEIEQEDVAIESEITEHESDVITPSTEPDNVEEATIQEIDNETDADTDNSEDVIAEEEITDTTSEEDVNYEADTKKEEVEPVLQ